MITPYNPAAIEKKWQKKWDDEHTFSAKQDFSLPKFYALVEFPYPSGSCAQTVSPRIIMGNNRNSMEAS